ncbi:phage tail family protein [Nocardiopsis sp. EMB25]|uniref:phage distal tail protein n=1 Tax=Nocardiopsis sp. EMB25 TaxID=2835867 RepID=UPI00228498EF|nr:phage tail domain-containing protein [Nocardiopsis sp. EMB25]MCY9786826.1 phage tail family protein [Nocardiopsis sp. EMB25]
MPIVYLPAEPVVPAPEPVVPGSPVGSPPRVTWTSAAGQEVPLSDIGQGYAVLEGARGLAMPTYQLYQSDSLLDGTVIRGTRTEAREVFLPIYLEAPTRPEVLAKRRALAQAFSPTEADGGGNGVLEVAESTGQRRWIRARYVSGMDGPEGGGDTGMDWATYGLNLLAAQPYWERTPVTVRWALEPVTDTWLPILPVEVRDSGVVGQGMTIRNPGSVRGWPVWTITGPLSGTATMRNVSTGAELEFTATLAAGEQIIIDTRPRHKTVRDHTGANRFSDLALGSVLWPLAPGANTVDIILTGLGTGSLLEMALTPWELTA